MRKPAPTSDLAEVIQIIDFFNNNQNVLNLFGGYTNEQEGYYKMVDLVKDNCPDALRESLEKLNDILTQLFYGNDDFFKIMQNFTNDPIEHHQQLFDYLEKNPAIVSIFIENLDFIQQSINSSKQFVDENKAVLFAEQDSSASDPHQPNEPAHHQPYQVDDDASTLSSSSGERPRFASDVSGFDPRIERQLRFEVTLKTPEVFNLIKALYSNPQRFSEVITQRETLGTEDEKIAIAQFKEFNDALKSVLTVKLEGRLGTVNYQDLFKQNMEKLIANPRDFSLSGFSESKSHDKGGTPMAIKIMSFFEQNESILRNIAKSLSEVAKAINEPHTDSQHSSAAKVGTSELGRTSGYGGSTV